MAVITIPSVPPAPMSIEFSVYDPVAVSVSPFTGQQQVQNWGASWMECSVTLPPLTKTQADAWIQFLRDLHGQANTFQFTSDFAGAYATSIGDRHWRLKSNLRKWSVANNRFIGITFEAREAL